MKTKYKVILANVLSMVAMFVMSYTLKMCIDEWYAFPILFYGFALTAAGPIYTLSKSDQGEVE